jgi:hypothetical protein
VADLAATIAVFVTLIYLAIQVRAGNRQAEIEALRHTLDGFNQWCDLIVGSTQTASMLNRGRDDLSALSRDERLQFDHLHIRFLNTVEGWYRQVDQTSRDADYRAIQMENIESAVQVWLGNPGSREVWDSFKEAFPLVAEFIDEALDKTAPSPQAEA